MNKKNIVFIRKSILLCSGGLKFILFVMKASFSRGYTEGGIKVPVILMVETRNGVRLATLQVAKFFGIIIHGKTPTH